MMVTLDRAVHVKNLKRRKEEVRNEMMKMNKKSVVAIILAMLVCVGVAYAAYSVYSPVAGITVDNQVAITSLTNSGSTITIIATVTPAASGITVHFWRCDSGGTPLEYLGSAPTDGSGNAPMTYTATANGDYYFKARADIP